MAQTEAGPQTIPQSPQQGQWWEGGQKVKAAQEFTARRLDTQLDRLTRSKAGRRSRTKTDRKRGRYIQSRRPGLVCVVNDWIALSRDVEAYRGNRYERVYNPDRDASRSLAAKVLAED